MLTQQRRTTETSHPMRHASAFVPRADSQVVQYEILFVLIAHAVAHVNLLRAVELRRLGVRPKAVEVKRAGVLVAFVTLHHQREACRLLRNLLAAGLARAPSTRVDLSYGVEGMLRSVALGAGLHAMRYIERGRV